MESNAIFTDLVGVMAVITMVPVFFVWLEKRTQWKIFEFLPAIIWIFMTPIFLSNLDVIPFLPFDRAIIPRSTPIYSFYKLWAVPMFIVLMLLDINIRESLKVAWRGVAVLVMGALGIVAGAAIAFYLFRNDVPPDTWSGFGALAGSWIGGTGNLMAVAESLDTPGEMVGMVVLVDNIVYLFYFPIILMSKNWAPLFNRFTGVRDEDIRHIAEATQSVEKKKHEVHFKDLLTLLGWGFTAILIANLVAKVLPEAPPVLTEKTWAMLLVTTFGIIMSSTPLKKIPGTEPLSMTLVYISMTMIGASADLRNLGDAKWFLAAGFICIGVHFLFIILGARLLRLDVSMAAVASVAAVGGAASAPIAAGYHREELVPVSIMLALIGYGLGNYLGVAAAQLCQLLM
jgi:uncharacterized membrane protein